MVNEFMREHDAAASRAYPHVHNLTAPLRAAARAAGDGSLVNLWAGQAHALSRQLPAAQIIEQITADAAATLTELAKRFAWSSIITSPSALAWADRGQARGTARNLARGAIQSGGDAECLSHDYSKEDPMADTQQPSGVSRRKVVLAGAGLVAAGAVAGAAGGLATTQFLDRGDESTAPKGNPELPVMVHLRDAHAGHFDVFVGDRKVTVVDTRFAARLVSVAEAA